MGLNDLCESDVKHKTDTILNLVIEDTILRGVIILYNGPLEHVLFLGTKRLLTLCTFHTRQSFQHLIYQK